MHRATALACFVFALIVNVGAAAQEFPTRAVNIIGYGFMRLGAGARALYIVTGLCLLTPIGATGAGRLINLVGVAAAIGLLAWYKFRRDEAKPKMHPSP